MKFQLKYEHRIIPSQRHISLPCSVINQVERARARETQQQEQQVQQVQGEECISYSYFRHIKIFQLQSRLVSHFGEREIISHLSNCNLKVT